jgi:hypothetical protein
MTDAYSYDESLTSMRSKSLNAASALASVAMAAVVRWAASIQRWYRSYSERSAVSCRSCATSSLMVSKPGPLGGGASSGGIAQSSSGSQMTQSGNE